MNEQIPIGELILQKLKEQERSVVWLAKKIGCDDSNLGKVLKSSHYVYVDLLFRISIILEEDFFIYYSQKLKEKQNGEIHRKKW